MWTGSNRNEIYRIIDENGTKQVEYINTFDSDFNDFRCFHKDDLKNIIKEALKYKD